VTVNGTAPTVANSILGGTTTATWNVVSNNAQCWSIPISRRHRWRIGKQLPLAIYAADQLCLHPDSFGELASHDVWQIWINWGYRAIRTNKSTGSRFSDNRRKWL